MVGAAGLGHGGASCTADDRVTVIDPDGGQPAELTVLAPDGRDDPVRSASRRRARHGPAQRSAATTASSARCTRAACGRTTRRRRGCSARQPRPARRRRSRASATRCSSSPRPAGRVVDGDPPASALVVEVKRAAPRSRATRSSCRRRSPSRGSTSAWTAPARSSYEVREGEYIQVIDVQGRQCSDFLAFHRAQARAGASSAGMDGVTTRTLMGAAYPQPGPLQRSSSTWTWTRSCRWCATRSAATTRSGSPARAATTRTWATPGT